MATFTRRKTAALALVIAGAAGLSIASAAQLNLTETSSLGAGQSVVAACQTGKIGVSFDNAFSKSAKGYTTTAVKLNGIEETCAGLNYRVTVVAGAAEKEVTGKVTAGSTAVTLPAPVAAKDVSDVAVVIFN